MIPARVRLGGDTWWDCQIPDDVLHLSDTAIAKAAVEAWWLATANYRGDYNATGRVREARRENDIFYCKVDGGYTDVALDLSQAGGPW